VLNEFLHKRIETILGTIEFILIGTKSADSQNNLFSVITKKDAYLRKSFTAFILRFIETRNIAHAISEPIIDAW
jgi:hypothetical protein